MFENWWHWPGSEVDDRGGAARQNAREVLSDSAACDMRHSRDAFGRHEFFDDGPIALVRPHQFVADFVLDFVDVGLR